MIRKAVRGDIDGTDNLFKEIFAHERECGAYTVWQEGVYPTRTTAEKSLCEGSLYVAEEDGAVIACMVVSREQPYEYGAVGWKYSFGSGFQLTVHLLCVSPSKSGRGYGTKMIEFAEKLARDSGCRALRLDTGAQNVPALSLYKKCGFVVAAEAPMKVGGAIPHKNHVYLEKLIEN